MNDCKDKILLVEDSISQAEIIKKILMAENFEIVYMENGKKAFEYLLSLQNKNLPQLILTDIYMPEMDGIELCGKIRSEVSADIPILVLTVDKNEEMLTKAFEAGASDYLRKPSHKVEILIRINNLISLKRQKEEYQDAVEALKVKKNAIKEASCRDSLTTAYNRSFLISSLLKRTKRKSCFSLCLFGIDGMKEINNRYGEQAGDRVLQDVASLIRNRIRATDMIARYDGDIFALIFSDVPYDKAIIALKKVHEIVKGLSCNEFPEIKVTITSSILNYDSLKYDTISDFLSVAAEMFKRAKSSEKDAIESAE